MNKRTILFVTMALLLVLAFVQVTLVSAEEGAPPPPPPPDEGGFVPDDPPPQDCEDPNGCEGDTEPPLCGPEGCEKTDPVEDGCPFGNPGNAKCVGKAGEKGDMGRFYAPEDDILGEGPGTHGRSDSPEKPHKKPHPTDV